MSDLLSSWTRRRAAVAAEEQAQARAKKDAAISEQQAALAEKTDEDILAELGLPDPATLTKGDDFKAFMAKTVPAHLRKKALRQLWRSDPLLACVDGLNDYDDDYLTQGLGQTALKTTYQVGKGLMAHLIEQERQKAVVAEAELTVPAIEELPEQVAPTEAPVHPEETNEPFTSEEQAASYTPRRMQFYFEENAT